MLVLFVRMIWNIHDCMGRSWQCLSPFFPSYLIAGYKELPVVRSHNSEIWYVFFFPKSALVSTVLYYWPQTARLFFLNFSSWSVPLYFFPFCTSCLCKWLSQHGFYLKSMFSIIHSSFPHMYFYRTLSFPLACSFQTVKSVETVTHFFNHSF